MLLPGVSGAYILVLLGAYETMLITLKEISQLNSDYFMNFISFLVTIFKGVFLIIYFYR